MTMPLLALATTLDDEADMYAAGLRMWGFHVTPVDIRDVTLATELLHQLTPAAVIIRLSPDVTIELVAAVRQLFSSERLPILALTTDPNVNGHHALVAAGASEVATIPLEPDALATIVSRYIRPRLH